MIKIKRGSEIILLDDDTIIEDRDVLNRRFYHGMAVKKDNVLSVIDYILVHSKLYIDDKIMLTNESFCLAADDLDLLEYDAGGDFFKKIMDSEKVMTLIFLRGCCYQITRSRLDFLEPYKKSAIAFFGDENAVNKMTEQSGEGFVTIGVKELSALIDLFEKEKVPDRRKNQLELSLKRRFDCKYIYDGEYTFPFPYYMSEEEFKKAPIAWINLFLHMEIRTATINDLEAIAAAEAKCFPQAEATTKETFAERLKYYGNHFWLMFDEEDKLISFVDGGFATDQPDLTDEMYEKASMHNEKGAWQMIFGVNTIHYRQHGYAGELIQKAIFDARRHHRKGLVLTCKDNLIPYYASFGFVDEGISESVHRNGVCHQMRLTFRRR